MPNTNRADWEMQADDAQTCTPATPRWRIALTIINWGVFAFVGVSGLSWWAVVLMVLPYPELMAQAGEDYSVVIRYTSVFTALALVSGIALWMLSRRHTLQWFGQAALALAVIAAAVYGLQFL